MTHLLIGIDPSLSCTGVAALKWDGSAGDRGETLLTFGTIEAEPALAKAGPIYRSMDIATGVMNFIFEQGIVPTFPSAVILIAIEAPQDRMFGPKKARSATSLPGYGVCVGVVAQRVRIAVPEARMFFPTPMDWGSRFPTRGDVHKEGRVRKVEQMFRLAPGSLGPKSTAGNVADAILLARYARQKFELEQMYGAVGAR